MILEAPVRWWKCPSCQTEDKTQRADVHTQFHSCPALGGVTIPLVEVPNLHSKIDGRQLVIEREDYAEGASPVSSIRTERGDGSNDVTVFAPTAIARITN